MLETPIEVHPSNGEVVDWKDNTPFTFKFKGDKVSYIYGEMFNLATNKRRVGWTCLHNTNGLKGYNNEIIENHPLPFFDGTDYDIDYKYRYIICQQNIETVNLERKKDQNGNNTDIGLYKIENISQYDKWDNPIFNPKVENTKIEGFYLPLTPSKIFNCLVEFVDGYEEHKLNENSKTVTQPYFYFVAELFYENGDSDILKFERFDYHDKYIKLKNSITLRATDYIQPKTVALYVSPNAPNPSIYIGRTSMASMPMGNYTGYFILDNGMTNYLKDGDKHTVNSPITGNGTGFIGHGTIFYTTVRNMYVKIEDEMRRIVDYQVVYNSNTNNTQYYLMYNFPLPTNPSVNTPVEIYTNYIKTPWYDFKCRHKPTAKLTVGRDADTVFLKCESNYAQIDGISLKSYNFSVFNYENDSCVATTNNQYSYRQEWKFPLPTMTIDYHIEALFTSQEGDTIKKTREFHTINNTAKIISNVSIDNKKCSCSVTWDKNDFISTQGDVGQNFNIYRKIDNGSTGISDADDFIFVGTTENTTLNDYTIGSNHSYCYQIENSGGYPRCTYLYSDPVTTDWDCWSISALTQIDDFYGLHQYKIGDTWRFYAELSEPTITMQNDFQVHNGTSQYGQISRGNNNYDSGTFSSNILEMDCDNGIVYDDIRKVKEWKDFIYNNKAFLLKSSKGDVWIVGITDSPTRLYEQGINEPTIVSYNWIEIDDVRQAIIVD